MAPPSDAPSDAPDIRQETICHWLERLTGVSILNLRMGQLLYQLQISGIIAPADMTLAPQLEQFTAPSLDAMMVMLAEDFTAASVRTLSTFGKRVLNALLVNETYFFREPETFQALNKVLAQKRVETDDLRENYSLQAPPLRVLCVGCSTGQEPYSIAMAAADMEAPVDILATDISQLFLDIGEHGEYSSLQVQRGLPVSHLLTYFEQTQRGRYRLKQSIRDCVKFRQYSALDFVLPVADERTFDVIFCRNMLVYMSAEQTLQVIKRLSGWLEPRGALALGAVEAAHFRQYQRSSLAALQTTGWELWPPRAETPAQQNRQGAQV